MNSFEFAINMELEGEIFYRNQAKLNSGSGLETVCLILADDEKRHAEILTEKSQSKDWALEDGHKLKKEESVFHGIDDLKSDIRKTPTQLDFYREASHKEKLSIDLYKEYLKKATSENDKDLFEYLVKQEEHHFNMLDDLARMLTHAEEWVEDAEFGIRKEEY